MHARAERNVSTGSGVARWLEVSTAAMGVRYRSLEYDEGLVDVSQVQATGALRGRVKLDSAGRFAMNGGLATGRGFSGGWNTTGIGTGMPVHDVFLKQLFVSARAGVNLDAQVGGLYLERGQSTEATTYDNDGYVIGERVTFGRRVIRALDNVTVTRGYLGDLTETDVLKRLHRLDTANYYQILAGKHVAHSAVSVEFTSLARTRVVRAALSVDRATLKLVDRVRFENYVRVDPSRGFGFALSAQQQLPHQLMGSVGLSRIDARYGPLNGDLYGIGRRLYGSIGHRIGEAWLGSVQVARTLGDDSRTAPRTRLDVALAYDLRRAWALHRSD